MFYELFGLPGLPPAILLLLPLQLVTCAVVLPKEILPPFYAWIRNLLPSTYLGSGMLKAVFGGKALDGDLLGLLLISLVVLAVTVIATAFKRGKKKEPSAVLKVG